VIAACVFRQAGTLVYVTHLEHVVCSMDNSFHFSYLRAFFAVKKRAVPPARESAAPIFGPAGQGTLLV
jgi:hypothetical protein